MAAKWDDLKKLIEEGFANTGFRIDGIESRIAVLEKAATAPSAGTKATGKGKATGKKSATAATFDPEAQGWRYSVQWDKWYNPTHDIAGCDKPYDLTKAATGKGKGKSKATVNMADFEPVKGADGYYNWSSYKANRTKYCYAVATNGEVLDGKPYGTAWYGKIDFSDNGAYYTAKAAYDAKFGYTKKSDRK